MPKLPQVDGDGGVQLRGLGLLLAQRRGRARYQAPAWSHCITSTTVCLRRASATIASSLVISLSGAGDHAA